MRARAVHHTLTPRDAQLEDRVRSRRVLIHLRLRIDELAAALVKEGEEIGGRLALDGGETLDLVPTRMGSEPAPLSGQPPSRAGSEPAPALSGQPPESSLGSGLWRASAGWDPGDVRRPLWLHAQVAVPRLQQIVNLLIVDLAAR